MSHMPRSDWWGKGTPVYENNWCMELGAIPKADLARREHRGILETMMQYAEVEIVSFPEELDTKLYKHDAVFVRDSFISNQTGTIVMSNYTARERMPEAERLEKYFKQRGGFKIHTLPHDAHAEGGEFDYIHNRKLLFAGISRNNRKGVALTAELLGAKELFIVQSKCYHLDTVFTTLLNLAGDLTALIGCSKMIDNMQELHDIAKKHGVPFIDIEPHDAIDFDGKGVIAVNSLSIPGIVIGGAAFKTPGVEEQIKKLKIVHAIAPASQFLLSGGGVHCLTNELEF